MNPQITHLTVTPGGEVAQLLAPACSEQGLNREVQVACTGWGPGLNALRTSLRELT